LYFSQIDDILWRALFIEENVMPSLKTEKLSESEEMYLLTIKKLSDENQNEIVPISQIAEALAIQPVSVNQMVRKLDENGLVNYHPYKGVALSSMGGEQTQLVLRDRRIWKTFLNQTLGIPIQAADEFACQFEHNTPEEVIERLYKFLGEPSHTPDGETISEFETQKIITPKIPLTNIAVGQLTVIQEILGPKSMATHLATIGIKPGVEITLLANSEKSAILLELGDDQISLVKKIAEKILVFYVRKSE
jgi:DtxR family transcriptional regulator, Mn-dependent transcriptional regulator